MRVSSLAAIYVAVLIFIGLLTSVSAQNCPIGKFTGTTYSIIDITPFGAIFKITVSATTVTNNGWSAAVILSSRLEDDITINSFACDHVIGTDRKVITFTNKDYNKDLSGLQQFHFTFSMESTTTNLLTDRMDYTAIVTFFEYPVIDASCLMEPTPVEPLPSTTTQATSTTISPPTTTTLTPSSTQTTSKPTTTQSTSTTTLVPATPCSDTRLPEGATEVTYAIENLGWNNGGGWSFVFKYDTPSGSYNDWTMKIVFSHEVTGITPWEAVAEGPHSGGRVWFLKPTTWNKNVGGVLAGRAMADSTGNSAPSATILLYNNGVVPDTSASNGGDGCVVGSTSSPYTTSTSPTVTVLSTTSSKISPNGVTGSLPSVASQTDIDFTPSPDVNNDNPYDYNELLHMSLLFYEAQRSGKLPASNRIPWRGDSGLRDGCVGATCYVDLVGGWYDAGDYVKFGFPMAWTATVLAWGMLEFQDAYVIANEWENALDNIKWATDYFVKAHVSPNELYFQVGDPHSDHASWGHPETMTMDRPIYKIDSNHPGTEVAAETAAALAAASIIFTSVDSSYATNLLNHAIQLYSFADNYRGNYHESVPDSKVSEFYKSWSGYNDELMWGAMWLYKATNNVDYLNIAIQLANSVGTREFSWDLKGPGALVLLSQERSIYKASLFAAIDNVRRKATTPAGLTYFSQWGTNRYTANYALISLMAAKMEGVTSSTGQVYHDYAKEQLSFMLGSGDGDRSYVVGFGNNPPQRPHHRSSSCRLWNEDSSSQVCDSQDRDASGPNPLILYGALVGGPGQDGSYSDVRSDYVKNEVAVDYNAGFQSAVAGLKYFQL